MTRNEFLEKMLPIFFCVQFETIEKNEGVMEIITKSCENNDVEKWIKFLDRIYSYESPQSYAEDFAPLFEKSALENSRILYKGTEIISCGTLFPVKVIEESKVNHLGVVGAIATDPDHRRMGYSKKVLEELEVKSNALSLDGIILWSDQREFYSKLGFSLIGNQKIFQLNSVDQFKSEIGDIDNYWSEEVIPLYNSHQYRCDRSKTHWNLILKNKSSQKYQIKDKSGKVRAYLAFDKGKDLQNIIHEWGGDKNFLLQLVSYVVLKKQIEGIKLFWLTGDVLKNADPIHWDVQEMIFEDSLCLYKELKGKKSTPNFWIWGFDSL